MKLLAIACGWLYTVAAVDSVQVSTNRKKAESSGFVLPHSSRRLLVRSALANFRRPTRNDSTQALLHVPHLLTASRTPTQESSADTTMKDQHYSRWHDALRLTGSRFDGDIWKTALPAMVNLAVVPLVVSIETMWVGRLAKDSLALAGQSAANSSFLSCFFLVSFLPTMAAPLIASAVGAGDDQGAQRQTCQTLWQALALGMAAVTLLFGFPRVALRLVLPKDAPALGFAIPYLRIRALSLLFETVSATGTASFRGLLDTVTPLKISSASRFVKLILDPILMMGTPLGLFGAVVATLAAEIISAVSFWRCLVQRKLLTMRQLSCWPDTKSLQFLLKSGTPMLLRQLAINVAFIASTRFAQSLDPSGVTGAAYGIVNQIYTIGFVVHVAMQGAAAALIPATGAQKGLSESRRLADRLFVMGGITGVGLGVLQYALLPFLLPLFTQIPQVQQVARIPGVLACVLHVLNGPRFAGEGILMGTKSFCGLTGITVGGVGILVAALTLTPLGQSLPGIMWANILFCGYQTTALLLHHLFVVGLSEKLA